MPSEAVLNLIIIGLLLATSGFAAVVGGSVERWGVAVLAGNFLLTVAAQGLLGESAPIYVFLLLDLSTAVAFGVLALRNPERLWPGMAGVAMFFVMVFSATRAIGFPLSGFAYVTAINLSGLLVEACLVAGACMHRWGPRPTEDLAPA